MSRTISESAGTIAPSAVTELERTRGSSSVSARRRAGTAGAAPRRGRQRVGSKTRTRFFDGRFSERGQPKPLRQLHEIEREHRHLRDRGRIGVDLAREGAVVRYLGREDACFPVSLEAARDQGRLDRG